MDASSMMLLGYGVQAAAGISAGMSARDAGRYNATMLERRATEERAVAQRTAAERRRETDRVIGRQIALAAASGAGFGPSVIDLVGDTAARGEYQAQGEMYTGESRARNLETRAGLARYQGDAAFSGSILEGVGTVAVGLGRAASRRNTGVPSGLTFGTGSRVTPIGPWRTTVSFG